MPPTLHRYLIHGLQIIAAVTLPIGQLSEEAQEAKNKDFKRFRDTIPAKIIARIQWKTSFTISKSLSLLLALSSRNQRVTLSWKRLKESLHNICLGSGGLGW
uniref:Uncharacterized protein n=1 Tax=Cacopsylla melanoneura TaxID=428564 RepID=A0A8D8U0M9_9HEMI